MDYNTTPVFEHGDSNSVNWPLSQLIEQADKQKIIPENVLVKNQL